MYLNLHRYRNDKLDLIARGVEARFEAFDGVLILGWRNRRGGLLEATGEIGELGDVSTLADPSVVDKLVAKSRPK